MLACVSARAANRILDIHKHMQSTGSERLEHINNIYEFQTVHLNIIGVHVNMFGQLVKCSLFDLCVAFDAFIYTLKVFGM